jgi:hypothetical protein
VSQMAQTVKNGIKWLKNDWKMIKKVILVNLYIEKRSQTVCNGPQTAQTVSQMAQTVENGIKWLKKDWKMIERVILGHLDTHEDHKRYATLQIIIPYASLKNYRRLVHLIY